MIPTIVNATANQRSFTNSSVAPHAGSDEEKNIFKLLEKDFTYQFQHVFPDRLAPKTVVIIPSLTLDSEILDKIKGHVYYEERMLCMLMLLRMPQTQVVFVSSIPVDQVTIDYYLHLLPGITGHHARQRLTMLSCYDASAKPLTQKILERPRLMHRIKQKISDARHSHLICFNVADVERSLAVELGIPVFGCDPDLLHLGSKSGSRILFKECGTNVPPGFENLHTQEDVAEALYQLKLSQPALRKAVIKVNEGFSGEGNAIFRYPDVPERTILKEAIVNTLPSLQVIAEGLTYHQFFKKLEDLGGIVEAFIDGAVKRSPSVQCRVVPSGVVEIVSTHDQILGGADSQVYLGAIFPASADYAMEIADIAKPIAARMATHGVLGRFAIDFLSVFENNQWTHYAIEINLRKGGTTHPLLMLQFLTDGFYDAAKGIYFMPNGQSRYYYASDNVSSPAYIGLTPSDLVDVAMFHGLMYDGTTQEGVMFHLIGALSQYGKLGMVCIASSPEKAKTLYEKTIAILDYECN